MPGPSDRIRRPDPIKAAEAAFRKATTKSLEAPPKPAILPHQTVSLKLDRDVLAVYQADGPGWQERINAALRKAAGLNGPGPRDEGMRPEQLTAENDD